MFRIAIKNLWAHRRTNIWLLIEIVLVTVVGWFIINPLVVYLYDSATSLGYDIGRLVFVEMKTYPEDSNRFDPEMAEKQKNMNTFLDVRRKLLADPRVESVTIENSANIPATGGLTTINKNHEGKEFKALQITYYHHTDYFRTLGAKAVEYSPSVDELSDTPLDNHRVVITRELADSIFPGENPMNRIIGSDSTENYYVVAGVVENLRMKPNLQNKKIFFKSQEFWEVSSWRNNFLVRLRPGVDADDFAADMDLPSTLATGNWYVDSVSTIADLYKEEELIHGITNSVVISTVLTLFFILVLVLGVSGLFWMQTRRRSRDAGIMKAFGASPWYITRIFMLEGIILTLTGWFIGCVLYLQYVIKEGFHDLRDDQGFDWVDNFPLHLGVIGGILLLLLLVAVVLGIMIPARKVAMVPPVEALHDE